MEKLELTKEIVRGWWLTTTGEDHFTRVLGGYYKRDATTYNKIKSWTHELVEERVITKSGGKRDGMYRLVDKADEEIMWWLGEDIADNQVNLALPFGLHKACYVGRPAVVLVSGDTNAGKTAIVDNIINYNLSRFPPVNGEKNIKLLITEGLDLHKGRMMNILPKMPIPPPYSTFRKQKNFEDDVLPNGLTVIDYLRPPNPESLMSIGAPLEAIASRVDTGIVVIAIQKPKGERSEGFGKEITAWDSTLYMSIHSTDTPFVSYLKLLKVKKPLIFDRNLYQLKIKFKMDMGIRLTELEKVYE